MLTLVIVVCEVGFWIVLAGGMLLRYPLSRPRAGAVVLACVPLVDVVLLAATGVDLHRGAEFEGQHALAAAYLGFSVVFGHSLVRWADVRFAHRFAGGPPPPLPPVDGSVEKRTAVWAEWRRAVGAATVATAVLAGLVLVVESAQRLRVVESAGPLWVVVAVWFVAGPGRVLASRGGLRPAAEVRRR